MQLRWKIFFANVDYSVKIKYDEHKNLEQIIDV